MFPFKNKKLIRVLCAFDNHESKSKTRLNSISVSKAEPERTKQMEQILNFQVLAEGLELVTPKSL
jgi:hypothetical protein